MGDVWMSEFCTDDLPNYTKLHTTSLGLGLATATVNEKGEIYAASLDIQDLKSSLYKLDPKTFEPTLIGHSTDGYVDLAPAPGLPGNSLMAIYGANVLLVDATTGDYYAWYSMFDNYLVGLAYIGTEEFQDYGYDTQIDWYFIIDQLGYVYLLGFLEQDGDYYYMEHDVLAPGGVYTRLDFEMETSFFGSAYFDGEYLYFSAYRDEEGDSLLMAIDVTDSSKNCYTLGNFGYNIWPVCGLMELGLTELPDYMSLEVNAQPKAAEQTASPSALSAPSVKSKAVSDGGLTAVLPMTPMTWIICQLGAACFTAASGLLLWSMEASFDRLGVGHDEVTISKQIVKDYYDLTCALLDGSITGAYEETGFRKGDVARLGMAELWYQCDA
jgi:hypothetical protein